MPNPMESLMQADLDRMRALEQEVARLEQDVEAWKAAYRKAIRHDARVIRSLRAVASWRSGYSMSVGRATR